MQALRNAIPIIRFVLVWFALSVGVAMASPIVKPQSMELICSTAGAVHLVVQTDEGFKPVSGKTLDCPLCLPFTALAPIEVLPVSPQVAVKHAQPAFVPGHFVANSAAPLPARGPPAFL